MITAALLASLAAWWARPASSRSRARRVLLAPTPSQRLDPAIAVAALVPVAAIVVLGLMSGVLVGAVLAPVSHRIVSRLETSAHRRRLAAIQADLPMALDLVVAALVVGRPAGLAFTLAAEATTDPLGAELGLVARRLAVVADPVMVWQALAEDPALGPVGRAFRRAASSGMPVAEIVKGVADEMRRDRMAERRERSQRVGVHTAAPLGLCFLPAFFLVGIVPTVIASFGSFAG